MLNSWTKVVVSLRDGGTNCVLTEPVVLVLQGTYGDDVARRLLEAFF